MRLHTSESVDPLAATPSGLAAHEGLCKVYREILDEMKQGTVAEVEAEDIDTALDLVTIATDLLRVFQRMRTIFAKTTMFGLPGQLYRARIRYIIAGAGPVFRNKGEALGFTFNDEAQAAWRSSPVFPQLAEAIGAGPDMPEGLRRALLGVQLMSQAILEHRPPFKLLNLVIGLESMLLEREHQSQSFRLARRATYFTCGGFNESLCGRGRDTCQCLALDPADRKARQSLKDLRTLAQLDTRWRCSSWLDYLHWYDLRSEVAHGDDTSVSEKDVSTAEFCILRWAAEPVLQWLIEHPDDPLVRLDAAIGVLPAVPRWQDPVPDPATYDPEHFDFSG
jgi:hypothetical protein